MGPSKLKGYYAIPFLAFRGFAIGRNDFSVKLDVAKIIFAEKAGHDDAEPDFNQLGHIFKTPEKVST